jgi:DNA uptake protein ComE-like DNA-binding protein
MKLRNDRQHGKDSLLGSARDTRHIGSPIRPVLMNFDGAPLTPSLTPSLSPSDGERVPGGRVRGAFKGSRAQVAQERGSVLIIVLWISFGLVSIALYFGHSMFFEFRASDNAAAGTEAQQAIDGAARYVGYVITNLVDAGKMPELQSYEQEEVPLGDATFWLIGRPTSDLQSDVPSFGLVDEASKLNLNTATLEMLQALPRMTEQLAAAIVDWRDTNSEATVNGAESETYQRLNPSYTAKNANFESVEELRLVYGADPEILYGEDYNRNGILDANENDADLSPPNDNRDGKLDPGILEYLTVYSREPTTRTNGSPRIVISSGGGTNLTQLLQEKFDEARAREIQQQVQAAGAVRSVLEFYLKSKMTSGEFAEIERDLIATNLPAIDGLINVNTASAAVLACVPGIGPDKASQVVAHRQSQGQELTTMSWVTEVLDEASVDQAGPYLTSGSYQFTADIAAVGHHGRGYRRTQFVFDTSEGQAMILYRRDLSRLGWALGIEARERSKLLQTQQTYSQRTK